jgi:hypothetical protein
MGQWTPYIGAQYLHEWDADDQLFPYQNIDTDLYSARIGIRSRNHTFYVAATRVPEKEDAFLNGAYFSPYSFGIYNQTPLESGQPLVSMVTSNQPGNTLAARYVYHSDRFLTVLGYTHLDLKDSSGIYYPLPAKNIDAGFMILGYDITNACTQSSNLIMLIRLLRKPVTIMPSVCVWCINLVKRCQKNTINYCVY